MLKLTCTFLYETNAGQLLSGHLHSHSIVHCVCCPCWLSVCLHCSCSFPSQTFMLAILYYYWHAVATDTVTVTAAPYVQRIDSAITRLGRATAPYLCPVHSRQQTSIGDCYCCSCCYLCDTPETRRLHGNRRFNANDVMLWSLHLVPEWRRPFTSNGN